MKDPRYRVYFIIGIVILCLFSLSTKTAKNLRGALFATLTPAWEQATVMKDGAESTLSALQAHAHDEIDTLKLENRRLLGEINTIKEMVRREISLLEELKRLQPDAEIDKLTTLTKRRYWRHFNLLMQLKAVPAKIVYRSPAFWDQCCWVNVGTETNEQTGATIVAKNSPVVVGDAIVGVIDEVGPRQARVRLLTDGALTPSVRVLRKLPTGEDLYLAKGEIHGGGKTLWRGQKPMLKGEGFNYDFDDEVGPSRDLQTGRLVGEGPEVPETPLIQEGDLLVTTGMDGVFPPDFHAGEVVHVYPLGEGDYTYEIEAMPSAGNFDEITRVFVLPPWN